MMEQNYTYLEENYQPLNDFIRSFMNIESFTMGRKEDKWKLRFIGSLKNPEQSEKVFDLIEEKSKTYKLTPLLSEDNGKHYLLFIDEIPTTKKSNPRTNLLLFIITLFSVLITGGLFSSPSLPEQFGLGKKFFMIRT